MEKTGPVVNPSGVSRVKDFEHFVQVTENQEAYNAALAMAGGKADFIFLTIFGTTGNGKSHLANAVAQRRQQAGEAVRKMTMMEILDYLQEGFKDDTEIGRLHELEVIPFLVIDELKAEKLRDAKSGWALERIEQIINYRIDYLMPTMITTNDAPEDLPPRICSRLKDKRLARFIWNKAADYRNKPYKVNEVKK